MQLIRTLAVGLCLLSFWGTAQASLVLRFDQGSSTVDTPGDTLGLSLDTGAASVTSGSPGIDNWLSLSGTAAVDQAFTLTMEAGFAFDPDSPTYDTADYVTDNDMRFRRVTPGVAPVGSGPRFSSGEILFFTITGLDPGVSLALLGYELHDSNPERVDLYYGPGPPVSVDTMAAVTDVSAAGIRLSNGDRFGFAYANESGNRSGLQAITFDLIPEPEAWSLAAAGLLGLTLAFRHRRNRRTV